MTRSERGHAPSTAVTRRRLLGETARLTAAAVAASFLPPNLRRAVGSTPAVGSLRDIKHVVLLMQENRSFDHYFGTLSGVRGFGDANAMRLTSGKSVFHQPDAVSPDGHLLPFHLDTTTTNAQKLPSTSHAWSTQHACWNGGKMDGWLKAHRQADKEKGPLVMGYHTRADIPFHFALAESFTICDAYHCSVMGPTCPNRVYWMTGTIDSDGRQGGPMTNNDVPKKGFGWTTYAERLELAGISWKVYQQKDNYNDNALEYFTAFRQSPPGSPLRVKGMPIDPPGQFEDDAKNDRLPAVSWIVSTAAESEHPDYVLAEGAAFVASKVEAIAANPQVWAKTVFILNYDENDGLFDHVRPPVPPRGTPDEFVHGEPIGAGFRVPCIIVSPWTAGGWVCSQPFDHTSVLQFLEKFTGVGEPNISRWRRRTFGDLTSAFRFGSKVADPPQLPDTNSLLKVALDEVSHLPDPKPPLTDQSMPVQEGGTRPRTSRQNV